MSEEEVKEVVDALAGEYPAPRCPNCKEAMDSLYSREPALEWNKKTGEFEETACFGESPELCCTNCHKPVDTRLIFEKFYGGEHHGSRIHQRWDRGYENEMG